MRIYGVIALPDIDSQGDRFDMNGIDYSRLKAAPLYRRAGKKAELGPIVGQIQVVKCLTDAYDAETQEEVESLRDFGDQIYVEATVADLTITTAIKMGAVSFGVCGQVVEKEIKPDHVLLKKTIFTELGLTRNGVLPGYKVYIVRGR